MAGFLAPLLLAFLDLQQPSLGVERSLLLGQYPSEGGRSRACLPMTSGKPLSAMGGTGGAMA
ncbi:MAG: hypothetical protein LVS60_18565 [Nodosilinea sp. LVE1205-7]